MLSCFVFYLLMSTIAGYAVNALHTSQSLAGLASGSFVVAAMVGRLLNAPITLMLGRRRTLMSSVVLMVIALVIYMVAHTYAILLLGRVVHGFAVGYGLTALSAVVLSQTPSSRSSEATGWFTAGLAISTGLGPFAGATIVKLFGYEALFATGLFITVLMLPTAYFALGTIGRRTRWITYTRALFRLSAFVAPRAFPVAACVMAVALGFSAVLTFIADYSRDIGLAHAGELYFVVYAAFLLVVRPVAGMIQDRRGNDIVMLPALICAMCGLACTAWAGNAAILLTGAGLLGVGYGTLMSAGQAMCIQRVGVLKMGLAVGSFFILVDGGTGVGPIVLSPIAQAWGYSPMLWIAAVLAAFACLGYAVFVADRSWLARRRRTSHD